MTGTNNFVYKAGLSANDVKNLAGGQKITKLSSNENPFGPSPRAIDAAQSVLSQVNSYPPRNDIELKNALAQFHGNGLSAENFYSANGGVEVISLAEDALIKSGERAIVLPPCFGAYVSSLKQKGVLIDQVPLRPDNFDIDVNGVLNAITDQTKLIYLCNPNNPTGTYFGEDELEALVNSLPDHVTLIYDEVYYQFSTEFKLPDVFKYVLEGRNIVVIHSFSKAYGLAGLRVGYGIAPPALVKQIETNKRSFHLNEISLKAAIAALGDENHLKNTVDNNTSQRAFLINSIRGLDFGVYESQANHVMFKCPDDVSAETMTEDLAAHGIMVRPAFFLSDHVRVSIGTPNENKLFLTALKKIVQKRKNND